ncbi:11S globulin [Cajanus cajan]|uniref:Glutelin type-A 2 n=1 Tax=Cajanus cajan TaxID=3821 RepID=A0A151UBW6_CAJCA|nr:11S globulin [Cajanus cajan]XP_029127371.1 11S globulin [Cajanus cajan]KYP76803.1 Glutelin type-A 2 [Cajanus cajan]
MELDLTPRRAETMFEGDGGGYYTWSSSQVPLLAKNNVCAGRLLLHPRGFALPHYADSSKIGYVIQGTDGVVGLVLPNTGEEVVLKLKKGDVIPVPIGSVSWWFNDGDSDFIIVFLGETSKALIPGEISYFFLTGALGIIGGFSTELTGKVYGLDKDEVEKLTKSQIGVLIIKLDKSHQHIPKPQIDITKKLVYNIDDALPENVVENAGLVKTLKEEDFPFIGDVGLSVIRVKLEPGAIKAPSYSISPTVQLIYIARGSGKIEIVDSNGKRALDTKVEVGHLLVVPQYFVLAEIAGEEGIECYSIVTTTKPLFEELGGRRSIWGALSPTLEQVALNVDSDFQKLFMSKIKKSTNLIPPVPDS